MPVKKNKSDRLVQRPTPCYLDKRFRDHKSRWKITRRVENKTKKPMGNEQRVSDQAIHTVNYQVEPIPRDLARLRVIIQGDTHRAAVMSAILADDLTRGQLP